MVCCSSRQGRNMHRLSEHSDVQPQRLYATANGVYEPDDSRGNIETLEAQLLHHSVLTWVGLPMWVLAQSFFTLSQSTCGSGYSDLSFVVLILIEVHHLYAEVRAWSSLKGLLAPREIAVMRQLGVLRKRRQLVILGILEMADLYTDLTFPFLARACANIAGDVSTRWRQSWSEFPVVGPVLAGGVGLLRVWRISLIISGVRVVLSGGIGLCRVIQHVQSRRAAEGSSSSRINGEVFLDWEDSARVAMMPSISHFCDEMALQRQYKLGQADGKAKDVKQAMKVRQQYMLGHTTWETLAKAEIQDIDEQEHIRHIATLNNTVQLVLRILLGNVMQLWLQSTFLSLTWDHMGYEARAKVFASMFLSIFVALLYVQSVAAKGGFCGGCIALVCLLLLVWCVSKVYGIFHCDTHVWNLTSGCVIFAD